jgi:hypothetical protein
MRVLVTHSDGSRTIAYDPGDRVRFVKDYKSAILYAKAGELGTVTSVEKSMRVCESIAFLHIWTDKAKATEWGTMMVPPWYVEYVPSEEEKKDGVTA